MLAEACRFYGWTVDHCLSMPAARFFAMMKAYRKVQSIELLNLCGVAMAPNLTREGYQDLERHILSRADWGGDPDEESTAETQEPKTLIETKDALFSLFREHKRLNGMGHG